MTCYLLPFLLSIVGAGDPTLLASLAEVLGRDLAGAVPGGQATLWVAAAALGVGGWWVVLRGFRRAEWPAIREQDSIYDILG
jgi:hypothetical protein